MHALYIVKWRMLIFFSGWAWTLYLSLTNRKRYALESMEFGVLSVLTQRKYIRDMFLHTLRYKQTGCLEQGIVFFVRRALYLDMCRYIRVHFTWIYLRVRLKNGTKVVVNAGTVISGWFFTYISLLQGRRTEKDLRSYIWGDFRVAFYFNIPT